MTFNLSDKWLIARLLVIGANVAAITSIQTERSNIDWGACFLISAIFSLVMYGWLTLIRDRVTANWSERYAWRQPFLPMNRYPFQFWFLISHAFALAGATALLRDVVLHREHKSVSATFLFMGLFAFLALKIWCSKFARRIR
jgi:hypothetical protein